MNYRHAFHAGNFADCAKHLLLAGLLQALARKPAPFVVVETHAGAGSYDLEGAEARATGEAEAGIRRVAGATGPRPDMAEAWLAAVPPGPGGIPRHYPGSPLLIAGSLRPGDRLVCAELEPTAAAGLGQVLGDRARVVVGDGYRMLRGLLPPPERRGLVFIDPAYEGPDEMRQAVDALLDGLRRWPTGVFALWYPLKDEPAVAGMLRRLAAGGPPKTLVTEYRRVPVGRSPGLTGSGLVVINPPYRFDADAETALRWLGGALGETESNVRVAWLVPER